MTVPATPRDPRTDSPRPGLVEGDATPRAEAGPEDMSAEPAVDAGLARTERAVVVVLGFEPDSLLTLGRDGRAVRWVDDLPRDPTGLRAWLDAHHDPHAGAPPVSRTGCIEPGTP